MPAHDELEDLHRWIAKHRRVFVLTGAGCSTASGIPDYRDERGEWKRRPPVMYQAFRNEEATYRRYWARAFAGCEHMLIHQLDAFVFRDEPFHIVRERNASPFGELKRVIQGDRSPCVFRPTTLKPGDDHVSAPFSRPL